jgi:acyl-CoA thioesterase-1
MAGWPTEDASEFIEEETEVDMSIDCTRRALALGALGAWLGPVRAANNRPPRTLLVVGDSLSAEYGLPRGTGWVALLGQRLKEQDLPLNIVNASISGETTSGGLARLPALLAEHKPDVVVVELGANDALRGLPLDGTRNNLSQMVGLSQKAGARVLLVGMMVPPNYGKRYADDFAALFERVSTERKVPLVPFMLKGVADRPDARDWFQADGTHPLPKAHPVILDVIWPRLQPLLRG